MDVKKININQSELTYNIASDIYDVSAHNDGVTFASLSELLSSENLSTLIPTALRCGGMSIRFIRSSDNKYVQYRLMSTSFSTIVANWQGIDDEPTSGSNDLVDSNGIKNDIFYANDYRSKDDMIWGTGHSDGNGNWNYVGDALAIVIRIKQGDIIYVKASQSQSTILSILKSYKPKNKSSVDFATGESRKVIGTNQEATIEVTSDDAKFLHITYSIPSVGNVYAPV